MSTSTSENEDLSKENTEQQGSASKTNLEKLVFQTRHELALRTVQIASNDTVHREWSEFHSRLR
jgi:hypothetical protein